MASNKIDDAVRLDAAARLTRELQALKAASGLSFTRIGERTHYAKSSWERWVNGKQFPPRSAVEGMVRACGGDAAQVLALWDEADAERAEGAEAVLPAPRPGSDAPDGSEGPEGSHGPDVVAAAVDVTSGEAEGPEQPDGESPPAARPGRRGLLLALAGLVVLFAGLGVSYALGVFRSNAPVVRPERATGPAPEVTRPVVGCHGATCDGKDPKKMNCSADAVTVRTGSIPKDLVIELRYSKTCGAAWGRISDAQVGSTVDVDNSEGDAQVNVVHYDRDVYTPLIPAPENDSMWVCASLTNAGPRSCTDHFTPARES
ncbi:DUF2690 domain-containing protein [Streptacidiphilus rugosus]|uniref:DUF2690 domain-containing protein n=1 Tax=Streptacidiphilus rugosus TaxID=405783 RepID=UPI00055B55C5|nr:DUF2690 domain-containing protein [Streptacidiphilus rugosus]